MKDDITVVIPTFNNEKGLQYLLQYFKNRPYKVVVINNKKNNLGFAGGVNKGVENVSTKWILILNDDIEFEMTNNKLQMTNQYQISKVNKNQKREIFKEMIEYSENKKLDALSPILVNPEGEIENCGYQVLPYGKIKLIRELPITDYPTSSRSPGLRGAIELDGLTAACLLIKTEVFKTLKGFNESFFAYLEDVDFFIRFKKAGYRFTVDPNIKVLHCQMTTSKQMGSFKERQDVINWWRLYFKHPDMFKFNIKFMIERLRNVSGFLKRVVAS